MISFLRGEVISKSADVVVISVGGVGYEVFVPTTVAGELPAKGGTARIHTRMVVRDDSITLYGFTTLDERDLFDLLVGVTGVGPKLALAFLSSIDPVDLRRSVVSGDAAALTIVPGVGKKVAQRVVLDLRDRLGGTGDVIVIEGPIADAREALVSLGLSPQEATEALTGIDPDGMGADEVLREALKKVGR
jgi:holliday junction DNA helicase RuvA